MTEFHQLASRPDHSWEALHAEAEARARKVPPAPVPSLDHLSYRDYQDVYEPSDDTFLLLDAIQEELATTTAVVDIHLEIGCGSGVATALVQQLVRPHAISLVTDVNPKALHVAQQTAPSCLPIQCDLLSAIRIPPVDLLVFNPPYVPTDDAEVGSDGIEASWAGGSRGRRVVDRVVLELARVLAHPHGVALLVTVDDNEPWELAERFAAVGLEMKPFLRRRARNEYLTIQRITWMEVQAS